MYVYLILHVGLPVYMNVYLIRRLNICLEVSGFFSTCRRWDQETTTGLLAKCSATGQKICFNSHMYRYASNCVCEMCTNTHYDSIPDAGNMEVHQC